MRGPKSSQNRFKIGPKYATQILDRFLVNVRKAAPRRMCSNHHSQYVFCIFSFCASSRFWTACCTDSAHFFTHFPLILLPLGRHFRLCCLPKMHGTMDIKFGCDFSRFWSPLGSHGLPFGSVQVAEMAPKMQSKSDLAANCNSASIFSPFCLQLAPFLAPFLMFV